WKLAGDAPGWVAVVEPDGTEVTAGALGARANQLVHGLRALGLRTGDCVATVLDNSAAMLTVFLAAHQAGWYLTPINWHLTPREIAYIVDDSEAAAVIVAPRFRAAVDTDAPVFAPGELERGQPTTTPRDRTAGASMMYTSGTTGKPKGVKRPLPPAPP